MAIEGREVHFHEETAEAILLDHIHDVLLSAELVKRNLKLCELRLTRAVPQALLKARLEATANAFLQPVDDVVGILQPEFGVALEMLGKGAHNRWLMSICVALWASVLAGVVVESSSH